MPIDAQPQLHALQRRVAILDKLARINTVLNSSLKLKPLLSTIMETAADITESEGASVLLWDQKTGALRFAATTAGSQTLIGTSVPLEGSIAGSIFSDGKIMKIENADSDPRHYKGTDDKIDFQTRSILGVPLISKERVIGVLEAVNKRTPPWHPDDTMYLEILAAQAAVAIETAQLVAALQKANEELNQLDAMKNEFIAIASHELRTPLSVILGYATFLQETSDSMVSENAGKVVESALQLRRIIEDLTNLRFLEQKQVELQFDAVLLEDFLRDTLREPAVLSEVKGHRFELIPPPPNLYVKIDRQRMAMALTNLLINAVRFTHKGGKISVRVEQHSPREAWVCVTDDGVGIPKEELERIFEKFYQVEDHMTRTVGGLGIGLSICRALVEAHGCRVWASSPGVGQGSTFTVTMPITYERATKN